ncbi:hypothetical protein ACLOJK_017564 [Asimina triloba]
MSISGEHDDVEINQVNSNGEIEIDAVLEIAEIETSIPNEVQGGDGAGAGITIQQQQSNHANLEVHPAPVPTENTTTQEETKASAIVVMVVICIMQTAACSGAYLRGFGGSNQTTATKTIHFFSRVI